MLRDSAYNRLPIAPPTSEASVDSLSSATSATVSMPCACSLSAVIAPTPHSRRTGSGCRKASSRSGRNQQQAVGLGLLAGHLGEELRAGDADGDRQPDPVADLAAQPGRDLHRGARDAAQPADVEERLVHRYRLHQRGGVAEDLEDRVAGLGVGRHPAAGPPWPADTAAAPGRRPSRCARRRPWPRSWPRAPLRRRRSPAGRAAPGRRAARRMRRTSRGRRAGWWLQAEARTYVRIKH